MPDAKKIFDNTRRLLAGNIYHFASHPAARRLLYVFLLILSSFLILDFIFPFRPVVKYSQLITASDSAALSALLADDDKWRMKMEPGDISPSLRRAFIAKEDNWYYWHFGVNPFAICRAAFNNIFQKKNTSGASTITMQTARLLEPKERTIPNKIIEMFRAMQLELHYSKEEILELYLNLAPYGGNIEGVKAASLLYFGVMPSKTSLAQTVALTIIPNRPNSLALGKNNDLIVLERNRWLRKFEKSGVFTTQETQSALAEPLDAIRRSPPSFAKHIAIRLAKQYPAEPIIRSAILPLVQQKTQNLCYNYSRIRSLAGIYNASVIVVNNQTCEVEGYVGNPNFDDALHQGQVDGVKAVRSPGSALKPLIYAMAFDRGLITPKSIITDVPVNFDGFSPENFNRKYNGKVTAEKALAYSLNIPAVKLANELGSDAVLDKLIQAGFRQIRTDRKNLGLSVILGGCGARLEELAALYSAFARGGIYRPLKFVRDKNRAEDSARIISPQSAYMITEILSQPLRPDLPQKAENNFRTPKIAWKTGTSYGRRDAWSIGYDKKYTIGVWFGNFTGEGVPELTGADIATPLLFAIFNSLEYAGTNEWFAPPAGLDFRYACSETGLLPSEGCKDQIMDFYIPGVSSAKRCDHLKTIFISPDSSVSYCGFCLPENGFIKAKYTNMPSELIAFYESEHIFYPKIPEHNPLCNKIFTEKPPAIVSPVNNRTYITERGEGQKIMLSCMPGNEVKTVYWYINDRFLVAGDARKSVFFTPVVGSIKISCSDDKGRNSDIRINVEER